VGWIDWFPIIAGCPCGRRGNGKQTQK